jgi:hypothetical protein
MSETRAHGTEKTMNGADALITTLADNGVTACFANPGTSEMQFVAALDREPRMRSVLCLFEGVATGAADGYGRMAGKPACTLLHLGPGYANGAANLHNARRAYTPSSTSSATTPPITGVRRAAEFRHRRPRRAQLGLGQVGRDRRQVGAAGRRGHHRQLRRRRAATPA